MVLPLFFILPLDDLRFFVVLRLRRAVPGVLPLRTRVVLRLRLDLFLVSRLLDDFLPPFLVLLSVSGARPVPLVSLLPERAVDEPVPLACLLPERAVPEPDALRFFFVFLPATLPLLARALLLDAFLEPTRFLAGLPSSESEKLLSV